MGNGHALCTLYNAYSELSGGNKMPLVVSAKTGHINTTRYINALS